MCRGKEAAPPGPGSLLALFGMEMSHRGQVEGIGASRGWKPTFRRSNAAQVLLPGSLGEPPVTTMDLGPAPHLQWAVGQ